MSTRFYTYRRDVPKLKPGERLDFRKGKGYFVVPAPKPKPPPALASLFFYGRGMFTVERPGDAAGLKLDYVLAFQETYRWETLDGLGVVFQDESREQYEGALSSQHTGYREKALVTSLDGSYHAPGSWPTDWTCMPECYWNADGGKPSDVHGRSIPNMLFRASQVIGREQWGKVPVVPVVGCYDASSENPGVGVRLTLPDYLPDLTWAMRSYPCVVGYAVWRVETLASEDRAALSG